MIDSRLLGFWIKMIGRFEFRNHESKRGRVNAGLPNPYLLISLAFGRLAFEICPVLPQERRWGFFGVWRFGICDLQPMALGPWGLLLIT
jgi:hypothetical protein